MLENHTESQLRNLVAFEQCHYPQESFLIDYVLFLDSLIYDRKDVEVLVNHGIILNFPGSSEDVYRLFSNISKGTTYSRRTFYYADVCRRLNEYSGTPWNRWKAILRQDYFSNPCSMEDPIDELATNIKKKCETLSPLSSKCCIYRIPTNLRKVNENSYTPSLISIGPFHRGNQKYQAMEEHKLRYLQRFIQRNSNRDLEDYLTAAMKWEKEARNSYLATINLSSLEFTEMLVLDGCFIIEFFLTWHGSTIDPNDRIFHRPALSQAVLRDLKLLENQVPFFILEVLYNIAFEDDIKAPSFLKVTCECMIGLGKVPQHFKKTKILHLVDFLRTYYLPPERKEICHADEYWEFPDGISELYESGVTLKVDKDDKFLNIKFENGVLYIPELMLENHTESQLRNLVAFEQCHYPRESFVVDYVLFLDSLIYDRKDVEVLVNHGIILNSPGSSEDVYRMFSNISKGTTYSRVTFYYADICRSLNEYCGTPWNRWKAILRQDYFNNPWSMISTIAAVVLLILTVIQTYCDIVQLQY
uniref:Uncharacterized protein n=2 Tax=Chenopodium quinoa TaxID=63459 RepID=A0A803M9U9_CHEQI